MIPHLSLNESAFTSVVLIHGMLVDSSDWDLVTPHLSDYHLLIPDCPGHGRAAHLPYSVASSADHIATLIKMKAVKGKAHIIGHSLGALTALRLASNHPDLVLSLFVSGFQVYPTLSSPLAPYGLWTMNRFENSVPRPLVRWLMDGTDIRSGKGPSLELCRQILRELGTQQWPEPWKATTLIVVAGKGGVIPSYDPPEDARKLALTAREGGAEVKALKHERLRHPWNRQDPRLWAEVTRAWVQGEEIPGRFTDL